MKCIELGRKLPQVSFCSIMPKSFFFGANCNIFVIAKIVIKNFYSNNNYNLTNYSYILLNNKKLLLQYKIIKSREIENNKIYSLTHLYWVINCLIATLQTIRKPNLFQYGKISISKISLNNIRQKWRNNSYKQISKCCNRTLKIAINERTLWKIHNLNWNYSNLLLGVYFARTPFQNFPFLSE